jgi:hypothetical protein
VSPNSAANPLPILSNSAAGRLFLIMGKLLIYLILFLSKERFSRAKLNFSLLAGKVTSPDAGQATAFGEDRLATGVAVLSQLGGG